METLHTVQLGCVKYLWRTTCVGQNSSFKAELAACPTASQALPNGVRLRGKVLVDWAGSLVGQDFLHIVQVASTAFLPLKVRGLMSVELWVAWEKIGTLARLVHARQIQRSGLEKYLVSHVASSWYLDSAVCADILYQLLHRVIYKRRSKASI